MNGKTFFAVGLAALILIVASSCLPKPPPATGGGINITLNGFSIMKEALEKSIYPAFATRWKRDHGQDVKFTPSFAGSENGC